MKIHIINGPNLNLLGKREPELYGTESFEDFFLKLQQKHPEIALFYFQSNSEGALIDELQRVGFESDGIILNPAAYTHYSYAIADTLAALHSPVIEVHISDIDQREDFRKVSLTAPYCQLQIKGLGLKGYEQALDFLLRL